MRFRLLPLVALATLLAGCFQVDSVLTVRPDGSGELTETFSADGFLGAMMMSAFAERAPGDDVSDAFGDGVTVRSVATSAVPGRAIATTVYAVADVSTLRYAPDDAFDSETMMSGILGGGLGDLGENEAYDEDGLPVEDDAWMDDDDIEDAGPDSSAYSFAFTPARGGAPAELRVTVPAQDPTQADLSDTPLGGGTDDDTTPEEERDLLLATMGTLSIRFAVQSRGRRRGRQRRLGRGRPRAAERAPLRRPPELPGAARRSERSGHAVCDHRLGDGRRLLRARLPLRHAGRRRHPVSVTSGMSVRGVGGQ